MAEKMPKNEGVELISSKKAEKGFFDRKSEK
jgi:hypothetical protein